MSRSDTIADGASRSSVPSASHSGASHSGVLSCPDCGAALAVDQRYCVSCGARCRTAPQAVAELISSFEDPQGADADAGLGAGADAGLGVGAGSRPARGPAWLSGGVLINRPAMATAVMALLAFGVLVGSNITPTPQSSADSPIVVALAPSTSQTQPSSTTTPAPASEPTPTPEPAATATSTSEEASTPPVPTGPASSTGGKKKAAKPKESTSPSAGGKSGEGSAPASGSKLPPIKHVFLIVLSDQGYDAMFGGGSTAPYLSQALPKQGELLPDYYAVTGGELANEIALISGQGPTPQTAANCPTFASIAPGTLGSEGQVLGEGCVYPQSTQTLADQLTTAGKSWRAYIGGAETAPAGQPQSCRHPTLGSADPNQTPVPGDPYVTWRNPFVYFQSLTSGQACAEDDVSLGQLQPDLASASKTPSFAYISPSRCQDGSEEPCAPGAPAGLAAADTFLEKVVPEIEASPAYKEGGLIAITSDQAPQSGPNADSSGCCTTSAYPNLPAPAPGSTTTSAATTTTPQASTATPTTATATATTSTTPEVPTSGATTPSSGTGSAGSSTPTGTPAGGGKVGLLLISKYVKPGSVNAIGQYNHFSLLLSIEDLFGLKPLGYAAAPGQLPFDHSVFNAYGSAPAFG